MVQNRSDKGNWYNIYSQKYTDIYDDKTYNDADTNDNIRTKAFERNKRNEDDGITIRLLA